jgi:hypothetical protein
MTHRLALPDLRSDSPGRVGLGVGLVRAERFALAAAVGPLLGGEWIIREHQGRSGTIALVLPRDEWDQRLPLFLVWRDEQGVLRLCMGRAGEAVDLGCFTTIAELTASIEREVRRNEAGQPRSGSQGSALG